MFRKTVVHCAKEKSVASTAKMHKELKFQFKLNKGTRACSSTTALNAGCKSDRATTLLAVKPMNLVSVKCVKTAHATFDANRNLPNTFTMGDNIGSVTSAFLILRN
jgi:hypothetical protein